MGWEMLWGMTFRMVLRQGGAAGASDDEGRGQDLVLALAVLAARHGQEQPPHGEGSELGDGEAHGGEGRRQEAGDGDVIEPCHGDVLGHPQAGLLESGEETHGHAVVGGEHRGGPGLHPEDRFPPRDTPTPR